VSNGDTERRVSADDQQGEPVRPSDRVNSPKLRLSRRRTLTLASRQIRRHSLAERVDGQTDQNINEHCRGEPLATACIARSGLSPRSMIADRNAQARAT
jgi:hypothetical protein